MTEYAVSAEEIVGILDRIDKLDNRVNAVATEMVEPCNASGGLRDRLIELEDFTAALDNDLTNIRKRLTHLETNKAKHEQTIGHHEERLNRYNDVLGAYGDRITRIEGQPASSITTAAKFAAHNRHINTLSNIRDYGYYQGRPAQEEAINYAIRQLQGP